MKEFYGLPVRGENVYEQHEPYISTVTSLGPHHGHVTGIRYFTNLHTQTHTHTCISLIFTHTHTHAQTHARTTVHTHARTHAPAPWKHTVGIDYFCWLNCFKAVMFPVR